MATTVASFKIHRYDDFHPLGHDGSTKELWNYGPMLSKYQVPLIMKQPLTVGAYTLFAHRKLQVHARLREDGLAQNLALILIFQDLHESEPLLCS
ncbi:hypothetical protein CGGC5_v006450 [Colletotrichum fructicola Nara gc5]|uniref:Uncharacterized protein n=1 Tax=Colletotrichum fructicola (strain Nara gc5) TaxID=1213859 RepID=A0A7J6J8Q0_COLFN|nr:hypothetical protein CGGC5_v006450 [Colletotrichum fructicola Nara gc5]